MPGQEINVHTLPRRVTVEELAGSAVVVIDVLRATTTICQALAAGATEVVPFLEVEDALAAAAKAGRANVVLGGERTGKRIEGFDLGNSPSEYGRERVGGKRVMITTTNGTRALAHARLAKRVLVGAIVNLSAVAESVRDEPRIDLLCAGTDGEETEEDILAAGGIAHALGWSEGGGGKLCGSAGESAGAWEKMLSSAAGKGQAPSERLAELFREARGGRNLVEIGFDADLVDCAQIDALRIAPELDVANWRITVK